MCGRAGRDHTTRGEITQVDRATVALRVAPLREAAPEIRSNVSPIFQLGIKRSILLQIRVP
eukprot:4520150-Prymnesium_polylepis.2